MAESSKALACDRKLTITRVAPRPGQYIKRLKSWKEVDWVEELLREGWFCSTFSCQTAETSGLIACQYNPTLLARLRNFLR